MVAPPGHAQFLRSSPARVPAGPADLVLRVRNEPLPGAVAGQTPLCRTEIWELWLDEDGRYVFVAPRQSPPRRAIVDPDFAAGEVLGDFSSCDGQGLYPLQGLDNVLLVNWLAGYGDFILHASGVVLDEEGILFRRPGRGRQVHAG